MPQHGGALARAAILLSAAAISSSASVAPAAGSLRALALTNADNDQDQGGTVIDINTATGKLGMHGNFSYAVTAAGVDCASTFAASAAAGTLAPHADAASGFAFYGAESENTHIMAIDAVTGTVLSRALLDVAYTPIDIAYVPPSAGGGATATTQVHPALQAAAGGLLVAVAGFTSTIDFISINASSGHVQPISRGLPIKYPTVCVSALSIASGRFYVTLLDTQNDDSDEEILTVDVVNGTVLSKIPWNSRSQKLGSLNAISVLPPGVLNSTQPELLVGWAVDYNFVTPIRLVVIDPATGAYTYLAEVPKSLNQCTVPSGSATLFSASGGGGGGSNNNFTAAAIGFDNGSQESYLFTAQVSAASLALGEAGGKPAAASALKLDALGVVEFIWQPAFVPAT